MAGHSQFKNIMYRKGAQDARRGKLFTKLIRELSAAARSGLPDPNTNPRLRSAIAAARAANMPKDNIDRAIKRAAGGDEGDHYEEMSYEGFGPAGVAVIVEALTDNRKRTASEIRAAFSKHGGSLGETNSVAFMFDRVGTILYGREVTSYENIFEAAVDSGADNVEAYPSGYEITCAPDDFSNVRDALAERFGDPREARLTWKARTTVSIDEDETQSVLKLLDVLEDNDDVQHVAANFEIADDVVARLIA
jgi:YebC/PmpR family DNA-binding regulatory protein